MDVRLWRLQTLLAKRSFGIPSLELKSAYEEMFGRELDVEDFGFSHLSDMVANMPEIFSVREPDEATAFLFPNSPHDRILFDARLAYQSKGEPSDGSLSDPDADYEYHQDRYHGDHEPKQQQSGQGDQSSKREHSGLAGAFVRQGTKDARLQGNDRQQLPRPRILGRPGEAPSDGAHYHRSQDMDALITYAWINRDDELPPNVVLPGECYPDMLLPVSIANLPGTRGLYKALIVSVASPDKFYISIQGENFTRITQLSAKVEHFFKNCGLCISMFSLPEEFIYPGFPCLVYVKTRQNWERCIIKGSSHNYTKVFVEFIDYGEFHSVDPIFLYLMPRQFFDLPRQAIPVSLVGLKPADGTNKWRNVVGERVRCFSEPDYWLDVLLLDPRGNSEQSWSTSSSASLSSSTSAANLAPTSEKLSIKRRSQLLWRPQFEVIVCDRHDEHLDIYLDQVLTLENYAIYDQDRTKDIENHTNQLKTALAGVPRPRNPFYVLIEDDPPKYL